jgi:hypothetical protein
VSKTYGNPLAMWIPTSQQRRHANSRAR